MNQVSWGVVGAGGIADRRTIPGLLEASNCLLAMVMDIQGAQALGDKYGVPSTENLDELLSKPEVQAVYVATPVDLHHHQVAAAARAGRHVLCEKPLARTVEEARGMVEVCESAGVLLQEGYMMRFHGAHRAIADAITAGRIGRPVYARAQLSCWYPPIPGAWRQVPERGGGGALIDMASHLYDLLEMFLGPVSRVAALAGTLVHSYPVDDASTTLLEFADGTQGTVDCFFSMPDLASQTRLEIYGSRGGILSNGTIGQGDAGEVSIYETADAGAYDAQQDKDLPTDYVPLPYERVNPYTAECEALAQAILDGQPVRINSGRHGLHILSIVEAAYESAKTGRFVSVQ